MQAGAGSGAAAHILHIRAAGTREPVKPCSRVRNPGQCAGIAGIVALRRPRV